MKRIHSVKLQHFKAFQAEQEFDFKGKNVLIFGNNGSGKSSLFWALYTFLQSSIKSSDAEVQKYFKHFVEGNRRTHQSLKNIYAGTGDASHIKVNIKDPDNIFDKTYTISEGTINTRPNRANSQDSLIQELNLASDFINYKLLLNFFRVSHKQEINVWSVFERDIFPFLTDGTQNWLEKIKAKTEFVPTNRGGRIVSGNRRDNYIAEIRQLNNEIQAKLDEIARNSNEFIKNHFFASQDVLRVELKFTKPFDFENIKKRLWDERRTATRLDTLRISLTVELKDDNTPTGWRKIKRVQSFLNEAMLTKITIGIRIGALRTRVQTTDFKVLVLDDMLISLDMSNRMDMVRILLNT